MAKAAHPLPITQSMRHLKRISAAHRGDAIMPGDMVSRAKSRGSLATRPLLLWAINEGGREVTLAPLKRACICLLAAVLIMAAPLYAQVTPQLVRIKQFSTLNGVIDFLPGAWVSVLREDNSLTYYAFRGGQFLPADPPDLIRHWQAFDWRTVDYLNQIAIYNYDPYLNQFLPGDKHVKNVVDIPLPMHDGELVLVCFTTKTAAQFALPGDTDIYLTGILSKAHGSHTTYKLLWTRKVETDASYGDFVSQNVPKLGRFMVLYWASGHGSGVVDALDIYRLKE